MDLRTMLVYAAERAPDAPAMVDSRLRLSYGQWAERVFALANALAARGIVHGDRVSVGMRNWVDHATAFFAIQSLGAVATPFNFRSKAAGIAYVLEDSGARAVIVDNASTREEVVRVSPACGDLLWVAVQGEEAGTVSFESLVKEGDPSVPSTTVGSDDLSALLYTSGTTGRPKAVPLSERNLVSSIRAAMLAWRWDAGDVLIHALPLFHQHGLGGLHATLLSGSRAVIHSRFEPQALCEALAAARATVLFGVPSIYSRLADWEGFAGAELRSLRLLVSGSAALSPLLAERIGELAGQVPLERYGTTESGLDVSNPYDGPRLAGSVGLPLPGLELAIADQAGEPLAAGRDGEILLRGPQVFAGYRDDPSATAEAFHPGGWFRTGDVGRVDPHDGYLRITGRLKELIITGGMNVYPREVEFALEGHPGVASAAVVGIPSERWGEEVVAAIVPASRSDQPPAAEELVEFARMRLAAFKCPKRVLIVDQLPVNALGKVLAAQVRELF